MSNSDTPRTDAEHYKFAGHSNGAVHSAFYFARQLERELSAMTAERDEARRSLNDIDLCKMAQAPCQWAVKLIEERDAQKAGWDNASLTALRLERERNEARECLREAMSQVSAMLHRRSMNALDDPDYKRWRKAAGLEPA